MAGTPAFQFYAKDFSTATQSWSTEEVGIYIRLLCFQWDTGFLPNDPSRLARICGCSLDEFKKAWVFVGLKFSEFENGIIKNSRLEKTREEQEAYREKQRLNGLKGGRPKNTETQNKPKENPVVNPNNNPSGNPKETSSPSPSNKKEINKEKIPLNIKSVVDYMKTMKVWDDNKCEQEGEGFFDHFKSNGWKIGGKTPMVDWQAAVRNWVRRNQKNNQPKLNFQVQELGAENF